MAIVAPKRPALCLLRIGFAVGCGAACSLLLALWVRNYWRDDTVFVSSIRGEYLGAVHSICGFFVFDPRLWHPTLDALPNPCALTHESKPAVRRNGVPSLWRPSALRMSGQLWIPHWMAAVICGGLGIMAGTDVLRTRRFSLRGLLALTTLLALLATAIELTYRYYPAFAA